MANFQRDSFERRANMRQRTEILRVAVALNHLGSHGSNAETQPLTNALLDFRAEMRSCAHRAGDFPYSDLRRRIPKTRNVALVFGEPIGDFQPEGDGFG